MRTSLLRLLRWMRLGWVFLRPTPLGRSRVFPLAIFLFDGLLRCALRCFGCGEVKQRGREEGATRYEGRVGNGETASKEGREHAGLKQDEGVVSMSHFDVNLSRDCDTSSSMDALPVAQLESLRFKANQIIESIQALQRTIDAGGLQLMPAWPDILSKYNVILSQTHSFYSSLSSPPSSQLTTKSPYENIALHPSVAMTDQQLDNDLIPLLRNQQTTDVLRMENATVRRLAECMVTRGAIATNSLEGQNSQPPSVFGSGLRQKVTYDDVVRECVEIRDAHDHRVERAVRAVLMLRDKFDWKQRVEVEEPEPEELEWDPRVRQQNAHAENHEMADVEGQSSDEEEVVEGELAGDDGQTPAASPADVEMAPAESHN